MCANSSLVACGGRVGVRRMTFKGSYFTANPEKAKNLGSFSPNFRLKEHFDTALG